MAPQDHLELGPVRLVGPEELELPLQGVALAAPHLAKGHFADRPPRVALVGPDGVHAAELGKVAAEDEGGSAARRVPQSQQALKRVRRHLPHLLDNDQVELGHEVESLLLGLEQGEGSVDAVHVEVRELLLVAGDKHPRRTGHEHAGGVQTGSLNCLEAALLSLKSLLGGGLKAFRQRSRSW